MAYYLILAIRIILAPLIFIWPTIIVILSFFLDAVDGDIAPYAVTKNQYHFLDETLDFWVYIFEMAYAWINFEQFKFLLLALFIWRAIGMVLFYLTSLRRLFIVFGNYFENIFFLVFFGLTDPRYFYFAAVVVTLIKFFQEWFIHVADLSIREDVLKIKRRWKK